MAPDATGPASVPLPDRPRLVVLHKVDVPEAKELAEMVRPELEARGLTVLEVSSRATRACGSCPSPWRRWSRGPRGGAGGPGGPHDHPPRAVDDAGFTVRREGAPGYAEAQDDVVFRIRGAKPERWVRQTDFANDEAVGYLADRLARLGVEEELYKAVPWPAPPWSSAPVTTRWSSTGSPRSWQ